MNSTCPNCGCDLPKSPVLGLTKRQRALLDFISAYIEKHRVSPSYEEMCAGIGIRNKSGINRLVTELQGRGHIVSSPNRARSISIIKRRAA